MTKKIDEIRVVLRKELPKLKRRYKISSMEIFGSVLREDFTNESDLDILVQFEESPSLLKFIELENYLSDVLNIKVDLVMKDSLKSIIRDQVLSEAEVI
jgi:predicted nucleotidyltransferase